MPADNPALTDALEALHDLGPGRRAEPLAILALGEAITGAADTLAAALRDVGHAAPQVAPVDDFPCCSGSGHGFELGGGATRRDAEGAPTHLEVLDRVKTWRRQGVTLETIFAAVERMRQIEEHG